MLIFPTHYRRRPARAIPRPASAPVPVAVWVLGVMDNGDGSYDWSFECESGGLVIGVEAGVETVPRLRLSGELAERTPWRVIGWGTNQLRAYYDAAGAGEWYLREIPEGITLNVLPAWTLPESGAVEIP